MNFTPPSINIEDNLPGGQQALTSCSLCGAHLQIMHACFIEAFFEAVKEQMMTKHKEVNWATWILFGPSVVHSMDCNRIYALWSAQLSKYDPHFSEEMRIGYIHTYGVWSRLKTHYAPLIDQRFFFGTTVGVDLK